MHTATGTGERQKRDGRGRPLAVAAAVLAGVAVSSFAGGSTPFLLWATDNPETPRWPLWFVQGRARQQRTGRGRARSAGNARPARTAPRVGLTVVLVLAFAAMVAAGSCNSEIDWDSPA